MTILELFILFVLLVCVYAIWQHNNISLIARHAAKQYCEKVGVQFLDQNVILRRLAIKPSPHALWALERIYTFEFSSLGDLRYKGSVRLLGNKIHDIELEPFKVEP